MESLGSQTFQDFVWIVADDSPECSQVRDVLASASDQGLTVRFCRATGMDGMERVANQALALADGRYVTFLDDDDTWEPSFLQETVAYLEEHPASGGVCTQSHIIEETSDPVPAVVRKYVMNADLQAIQIADMMLFNHLTTNSLVYRRALHAELGPYREDLSVMGDWEFGLRLVAAHEVGVIAKPLANYHRRVDLTDPDHPHSNTVISRQQLHAETDARLRNEMLRREWADGKTGPGHLMAIGRMHLRADALAKFNLDALGERVSALERSVDRLVSRLEGLTEQSERMQHQMRDRLSPRWWLRRIMGRAG